MFLIMSTPTTTPTTRAAAAASDSAEIMSEKSIVMSEGLRAFLQQAGVGQYENSFLEKLELTELVHLDQLLPCAWKHCFSLHQR